MTPAVEANADGLIGPTHSYAGLSPGNLASDKNRGLASNPKAAVLQGLEKMRLLADLGLPQFVLPPQERPDIPFLRSLGFVGSDARVLEDAWRDAPAFAAAACSASAMWAANAATVTPSADSADGRVHFTPANLVTNLHRSLEHRQTTRALDALFPDPDRFAVHDALPPVAHLADEGAANHVRLCAGHGARGVNLMVWGREAWEGWQGRFPARQTREASDAIVRRHGATGAVLARQSRTAIEGGTFHNDVVCVGALNVLFHHELAFEDTAATHEAIRRAADGRFEPVFVEVSNADLPLGDAIASYLFNSMLIQVPGQDRLTLICPTETQENPASRAVTERLVASNGPIGEVRFVDVRQSMRNGGGPACLRLRVVLTDAELAATNPAMRLTPELHARLNAWAERHYPDDLIARDLADPALLTESRAALDELTGILRLGSGFYPFQRG
ncbi:MAG: N-succinylarginine dihydrolase [Alphaproteobacteria bacterium]|nr:N-succinylarginine dihydrolase [Alphaproteobacteria bacterium]MBU1524857.1 N-succinylarginine dihydrolase [Alphaproteobacteria bacterium]MBU2117500.1 N-succinylarginine dihydrolase [Alphaproteobacteria bacterium]MBU2350160.1 N-succinylarginine dihydrolase [Alphaproteobacteria bacterium]MBU2381961.1 N-succinylarginine dihydrolase [Alphaproteobacteria bacterium]